MKKEVINVGLLGAGTVGGGVILVLKQNCEEIAKRLGVPVRLVKVFDRNEDKVRELDPELPVTRRFEDIIEDPAIDIVVELIGREDPAKDFIARALAAGKSVVTANKDVVAKYGSELFAIAAQNGVDFMYEAAVAGGIPIIRPLKACLAANKINYIMGIVNGTTNYMLTKMSAEHMEFADVLKEAQEKGYAESDPTADIGGFDAARKIAILASLAFNTNVSMDDVTIEGIEKVSRLDIERAEEFGYVVKLLAIAKRGPSGIIVRVQPTMLPKSHPLASVNDVFNAIFVNGDPIGDAMFFGRGAGRMPTASAVCADIVDCARNILNDCRGRIGDTSFEEKKLCSLEDIKSPCYVRLLVADRPGVLAGIAASFGAQNVSINSVIQKSGDGQQAELVVVVYNVSEYNLKLALATLQGLPSVLKIASVIRVEDPNLEE